MKLALIAALLCSNLAFAADPGQRPYNVKCASCHGKDGKGETDMGRKTKVKDLTDPKVQALFSDAALVSEITDGIPEKKMPGYKDKLSDDEIKAVAAYTRAFKK